MNGHSDAALPTPVDGQELMNAAPVYDAELVEERPTSVYTRPRLGRFTAWWLRSARVPVWLKSRQHAKQAAKDTVAAVVRSPLRYLGAVVRGLIAAARWWRRWVSVRDFREAAELSEKLADKFTEIRALTQCHSFRPSWLVACGARSSRAG